MKYIIGLGNPGRKYSKTRHNIGFSIIDSFAEKKSLKWKEFRNIEIVSDDDNFLLAKPMSFMNQSGSPVVSLIKKYYPDYENVLVIHDDMDIEFGKIQVKRGGSSGGHNGVQSIIDSLGTKDFIRLRIGIGRPPEFADTVDYVLSNFTKEEFNKLEIINNNAMDIIETFIQSSVQKTMNLFNNKKLIC